MTTRLFMLQKSPFKLWKEYQIELRLTKVTKNIGPGSYYQESYKKRRDINMVKE